MKRLLQKAVILPVIVAIAVAAVVFKVKSRAPLEHESGQLPEKLVEVITVRQLPFRSRATAYGHVEPAVLLKAKAEVSGKVSYIHPSLKQGGSLPKDTIVLRIEPTIFEFSLDQSQAGLAGSQSSLKQLEAEEKSTRRSLALARKNLAVGQKELDRIKEIWEKRLIARSVLDAEEQKVLLLRQQVEDLQGKLATYTSRKSATQAQIKQSKTQVEQTKDTLGRTEISLPFDARIGAVSVEEDEYVQAGSQLFEASGTQAVEINAQLPVSHFRPLVRSLQQGSVDLQNPVDLQAEIAAWDLQARVHLVGGSQGAEWQGKLLRISESIDPVRDTVGLVVAVNNPYEGIVPGERPPLLKGMYTSVEFLTAARPMLVIPRKAIHQGRVYVATEEQKLTIREVKIRSLQGELAVIASGLQAGEKIIITDVIPVIEGLPLKLIQATEYEQELQALAAGKRQ